jgi:hypothetical protein
MTPGTVLGLQAALPPPASTTHIIGGQHIPRHNCPHLTLDCLITVRTILLHGREGSAVGTAPQGPHLQLSNSQRCVLQLLKGACERPNQLHLCLHSTAAR